MEALQNVRRFCHRPGGALLAAALLAAAMMSVGLGVSGYGFAVFVFSPFVAGFVAAELYEGPRSGSWFFLIALSQGALLSVGVLVLFLGVEGLICIAMALPFASPLAAFGATMVYLRRRYAFPESGTTLGLLAAFPFLLLLEGQLPPADPVYEVRTEIEILATPANVWDHVVAFPELPPPTEAVFRLGIAYPVRAEINGRGPGATRYCTFSTGSFVEPIEVWEEPRLLRFGVESNPSPMTEWTPYDGIQPPHLTGFLRAQRGQFELELLSDGRTRLIGTTWYSHGLWPAAYWRIWGDWIIHQIHRRVLEHIRVLSEASK